MEPQSLEFLAPQLLDSQEICSLIRQLLGKDAEAAIERFRGDDASGLSELIVDKIREAAVRSHAIPASWCGDEIFEIEIMSFGPVHFIRADECDPIGFFTSKEEAIRWAGIEFETAIDDYFERKEEEEAEKLPEFLKPPKSVPAQDWQLLCREHLYLRQHSRDPWSSQFSYDQCLVHGDPSPFIALVIQTPDRWLQSMGLQPSTLEWVARERTRWSGGPTWLE